MTTKARKRAQARYDAKRHKGVLVRFEESQLRELDSRRKDGESRAVAIKRLLGFEPEADRGAAQLGVMTDSLASSS